MVNIIYRHYQNGDDDQLTKLYNKAFQMNGVGYFRTPKSLNWRYVQSPNFDPEMIQIAEDINKKKIVGAVYVNLVEEIYLNGIKCLNGDINDVACHPNYTRRGIANKLMQMAIEYMEKRNCDVSMLSADYNGFPKQKIYSKLGYYDVDREYMFINFSNIIKLIIDLPGIVMFSPIFFVISYLPRYVYYFFIKLSPLLKGFSFEINHNTHYSEYFKKSNEILKKYYTGVPSYQEQKMIWSRIKVPRERHKPTYIIIRENENIIGGATLTHFIMHSSKFGLKLKIGLIHQIFLNKERFKTKRSLHYGYIYLIDKIMKAANRRFLGLLLCVTSSIDHDLIKSLKAMKFIKFKAASVMLRGFKNKFNNFKPTKPLFIPTYVSFSLP